MKYKLVRTDTYNSLLRCINKALDNNHELRKVCQYKKLTLDELRQMDGQPVYITYPGHTGNNHWDIVNCAKKVSDRFDVVWFVVVGHEYADTLGRHWIAYTQPLKCERR